MEIRGLYTIVDRGVSREADLVALAGDYLRGGARIVQLRDKKRLETPEARAGFRETARGIAAWKREFDFLFIVNDDLETAIEVGADGVHVGKDDCSIEECRQRLIRRGDVSSPLLIGYSSHSLTEALEAEKNGADYVAFGAIFPTPAKGPGHPIQGTEKLRNVVKALRVPVVAIGGIGRDNIKEVFSTGVASVAMISALAHARKRIDEARYFSQIFSPL